MSDITVDATSMLSMDDIEEIWKTARISDKILTLNFIIKLQNEAPFKFTHLWREVNEK